jgi:hypothetical protein
MKTIHLFLAGAAFVLSVGPVAAASSDMVLHDFETGTEGWENEAKTPVKAYTSTNYAHSGTSSVAFDFTYGKGSQVLQVRCKEGYPRDFVTYPGFRGFSAWVYIGLGSESAKIANFEVQMFVRSGDTWQWATGDVVTELGLGWVKVEIRKDQIASPESVQDLGIQVRNNVNDVKATVYIDQVEAVGAGGPSK